VDFVGKMYVSHQVDTEGLTEDELKLIKVGGWYIFEFFDKLNVFMRR
jgi:hypothetical protein